MKSIKPGRGPSSMNAVGSIIAAVFGIFWTIVTVQMGAPPLFTLFGIVFVCMGIAQGVYHYKNATGKNRFSSFDITDAGEEMDPFDMHFAGKKTDSNSPAARLDTDAVNFCPYCGDDLSSDFAFCPKCGKQIPKA